MNKNVFFFVLLVAFSLCANQKTICGGAFSKSSSGDATLKKLNAVMDDYNKRMQEYVFEGFKKAGVSSQKEGDIVISAANKKKVDALVYKIFDEYTGLRSYGQLRSMPVYGRDIHQKMAGIIGDLKTQFEWFTERLTKNQKSVTTMLKVLGDMQTGLISEYCKLILNLQKITGNNFSTIKFESGKIVPHAWFVQMAQDLRKDLEKTKKELGKNIPAHIDLTEIISTDVFAYKQAALFAPTERELRKEAEKLALDIKTGFKKFIENVSANA